MQHSTRTSFPSPSSPVTIPSSPPATPSEFVEGRNTTSRWYTPLEDTETLHGHSRQTRIHFGRHGYDQTAQGLLASTENSSSTCVTGNHPGHIVDTVEPDPDRTPSSPRGAGNQKVPSVSPGRHHIPFLRNWKWEILSIVASLGLLVGIFVLLAKYNLGTQPEWPYSININSLISVLTAVLIAQLGFILAELISQLKWSWFKQPHPLQELEHYDAASRGVVGSFIFLGYFSRQPRACLAMGAAFIFLMLSLIGPFTQQSIKSYVCQQPLQNTTASIHAANWVDSSRIVAVDEYPDYSYPNLEMMTAALEGIFSSANSNKLVRFDCPTGNCDFASYSSLAYCSSCSDATSEVHEEYGPRYNIPEMFEWNYTLGSHCHLNFEDSYGHPNLDDKSTTTGLFPVQFIICPADWDDEQLSSSAFTVTVLSMSWANCSRDHENSYPNSPGCGDYPEQLPSLVNTSGLIAMNCSFGPCVRDYTGSVRNGVLDETTTSSILPNLVPEDLQLRILKLPCFVDSNKYDISNISQVASIPGRKFSTVSIDGRNVTAPIECIFGTANVMSHAINEFLLTGMLNPLYNFGICGLETDDGRGSCEPWYLQPFFHDGKPTTATISSEMASIADAISNRIRNVGSNAYRNGSGVTTGTAIQTTVCVRVVWPWLLLPAALVLLTVVLFVAVVATARQSQIADGQPIWKSSSVVALFLGIHARSRTLGHADGDAACHVMSTQEAENQSKMASMTGGEIHKDVMSLESIQARAKKLVVRLETVAAGQRGFFIVNEKDDDHCAESTKHESRRSSDTHRDGETLPLTQLPSNSSHRGQAPTYLQVDLGIGLTPAIRSSLDRSTQCDLEESPESES